MSNEIVWASVAAIVCGIVISSFLGGTGTPWWLVLATVAAGLVVTILRSRRPAVDSRKTRGSRPAPEDSVGEPTPERPPPVDTRSGSAVLGARQAESHRRAGARADSLRSGPPPRRRDDSSR